MQIENYRRAEARQAYTLERIMLKKNWEQFSEAVFVAKITQQQCTLKILTMPPVIFCQFILIDRNSGTACL